MTYCQCSHAEQIHGANEHGYLEHGGPRGEGRCSAQGCWCDNYTPKRERAAA